MAPGVARPGLSRLLAAQRPCCNFGRPTARTQLLSTSDFCFNNQRWRSGVYFRQAGAGDRGQQAVGPSCHLVTAARQDLRLCHVHGREAGVLQASYLTLQTLPDLSKTLLAAGIWQTGQRMRPPEQLPVVVSSVVFATCAALSILW